MNDLLLTKMIHLFRKSYLEVDEIIRNCCDENGDFLPEINEEQAMILWTDRARLYNMLKLVIAIRHLDIARLLAMSKPARETSLWIL